LFISFFGSGGDFELSDYEKRRGGFSGFIGSYLIAFGFFSLIWATLDPTTNKDQWLALMAQYLGGLGLSMAFGFRLTRRVPMDEELRAAGIGIMAGILTSALSSILLMLGSIPFSVNYEGVWLVLLAPIAEVLALNIFPYHLIDFHFPESSTWQKIAPSDVAFAFYHFFSQGDNPLFMLIIIILILGNTAIMYVYDMTRNATAPIVAHEVINLGVVMAYVVPILIGLVPIFIAVLFVVVLLEVFFKRFRT